MCSSDLSKLAAAYGMEVIRLDGNDVSEVRKISAEAIRKAREGGGPTLLVCQTFRFHGHFEGENVMYLNDGELDSWKARDPIAAYSHALLTSGVSQQELDKVDESVGAEIDEAIEFARQSPFPEPEEALADLFN